MFRVRVPKLTRVYGSGYMFGASMIKLLLDNLLKLILRVELMTILIPMTLAVFLNLIARNRLMVIR